VFASLDISGDIDVDGTTNLDVVDIDGAVDMASTALVTGVLTTTAATVFNGGFASNDTSTIIAVDGAADNTYALQIKNQEATDDRSYGVLIQAGSTSNDAPLNIATHDGGTSLFTLVGSGQARFVNGTAGAPSVSFLTDLDTGFYRVGTNSIGFSTAGVARFVIASDGSLYTPTLGTSNVRFGVNAGNSIIAGGNYNVVVGDEAGTAITTGDANVFVGYASGDATTTGQYNVAMGHDALTTNTTGANNVAVGFRALDVNTTASNNTAVGYDALGANTTGDQNVAVGANAGLSVTTGVQNTLIGYLAGDALTDADYNVALGTSALGADTLGSRAVAIGRNALIAQNFTSATDNYNVAVGFSAGSAVTTGVQNTLIGGLAGDAITTGNYNTAVG
jgi:hypothetical protein